MTEPTETPIEDENVVEEPQAAEAGTDPDGDGTEEESDKSKAGREAAKYRRQLRDTEAERDILAVQLATLRRVEVERVAGMTPIAFWAGGTDLAELLADDGTVDTSKVAKAAQDARSMLGMIPKTRELGQGKRAATGGTTSWSDAFKEAHEKAR